MNDENPSNFETIVNRFLFDYRNPKHCTTGESPAKIFFNRSLKTRFSSLRPPLVKDKIIESQAKSIQNYKGKRETKFREGQNVFIRDYTNSNKPSWSQATIRNQNGPRTYNCIISSNNREIKRHVDQMRGQSWIEEDMTQHVNVDDLQGVTESTVESNSSSIDIDPLAEESRPSTTVNCEEEKSSENSETMRSTRRSFFRLPSLGFD